VRERRLARHLRRGEGAQGLGFARGLSGVRELLAEAEMAEAEMAEVAP